MKRAPDYSILSSSQQVSIDGKVICWGIRSYPEVPYGNDDIYIQYSATDRLDKISYRYYNTPNYTWFIALANNIKLEMDIEYGTILRVPSFVSLIRYLSILKSTQ